MQQFCVFGFRVAGWAIVAIAGLSLAGVPIMGAISTADAAELHEWSAQTRVEPRQRPRIRVQPPAAYDYPRPQTLPSNFVRQCVDWYATEYRASGTVVTPQMRCRWVQRY